jgi:hypothetical protein
MAGKYTKDINLDLEEERVSRQDLFNTFEEQIDESASSSDRQYQLNLGDITFKQAKPIKKKNKGSPPKQPTPEQLAERRRIKEEKKEIRRQENEIKILVKELEELNSTEEIIKYTIKNILISVAGFERENRAVIDFYYKREDYRVNFSIARKFYEGHTIFLKNIWLKKHQPEVLRILKSKYYDNKFDDFINEIDIYTLDYQDFMNLINEYIRTICINIFAEGKSISKLLNEIYEIIMQKNEVFNQIKQMYQDSSFSRQKVVSDIEVLFKKYYKNKFSIKDYLFSSVLHIGVPTGKFGSKLREHLNRFIHLFKLPFELERQRVIEMQERQRGDRVRNETKYQQIRQREERNRIQSDERQIIIKKQFLEANKDARLEKAKQKYEKKYNQLQQQIERQFTQYDEELSGYKYQDPESKYNKFMRSMDSRFKITPVEYICPISYEIMTDPVVAADGFTYDRISIEQWFRQGQNTSPTTGAVMSSNILIPNIILKKLINEFK